MADIFVEMADIFVVLPKFHMYNNDINIINVVEVLPICIYIMMVCSFTFV